MKVLLPHDVPTKWNSTYLGPERIFEHNGSIGLFCLETEHSVPASNKLNLVGKMVELLSKFEEIARRLSKSESIVSEIIPNIRFIKIYMTKAAS